MNSASMPLLNRRIAILGLGAYITLGLLNGLYNPIIFEKSQLLFWIIDVLHYWGLTSLILFLNYKHLGFKFVDYGLIKPCKLFPLWEIIGAGFFIGIVLLSTDWSFWQLGLFFSDLNDFKFAFTLVVPEGVLKLPAVLYLAITAGFAEEVLFRGVIWKLVNESYITRKKLLFIFISSFLFSIIHWEQGIAGLISSFAYGVVAAMFFLQYRNLWSLVLAHTLIDIYYFW